MVGNGPLKGFPLYEFSGNAEGKFGCGTTLASGYDLGPDAHMPLTCTGPEADVLKGVKSDDWPALTSSAHATAGPGVNAALLGRVERKGIGEQVTYAGHDLYLFDPVSKPFLPQGEDYIETVAPLAPWHGYWFLVSALNGEPAPGRATLALGRLPDGTHVLAATMDPNVSPVATTVYTFSRDSLGNSRCTATCLLTWVPLLSSTTPRLEGGLRPTSVGLIRLADGTNQVTYDAKPLYLYAKERVFLTAALRLKASGTAGNGNAKAGPRGGRFSFVTVRP